MTAWWVASPCPRICLFALIAVGLLTPTGLHAIDPGTGTPGGETPQSRPIRNRSTGQGWALYGRVVNAQLQPVSGYSVFFEDGSGRFLAQYGQVYTGSDGSFQLNFAGNGQATPPLYVTVANNAGTPVYHNANAFQPVYRKAIYQAITLPKGLVVKRRPPSH